MSPLRVARRGEAAVLTIDRRRQRNALDAATATALRSALAECSRDDEVRAVVLTGAGDHAFCAGGDLESLRSATGGEDPGAAFTDLLLLLHDLPKPTLARVNGAAFGGGLGLALSCDLVVASAAASFGTPEVGMGLFPWMILPILQAHLGPKPLASLVLGGERLEASRARALGLLTAFVPAAGLDAAVDEAVARLTAGPPGVIARALPAMRDQRLPDLRARLETLAAHFHWNLTQPELAERVAAFLASRSPSSS